MLSLVLRHMDDPVHIGNTNKHVDYVTEGAPHMFPQGEAVGGSRVETPPTPSSLQGARSMVDLGRMGKEAGRKASEGLRFVRRALRRERNNASLPDEFRTPYCQVTFTEARRAIEGDKVTIKPSDQKKPLRVVSEQEKPEIIDGLRVALSEIDKQMIENFGVFESTVHPGVCFSYSKLSITQEVVKKIAETTSTEEIIGKKASRQEEEHKDSKQMRKNQVYFLFTAFGPPPEASAFTVQDVGIDRFMREIPLVARAMKDGEPPPKIDIYLLGYPTGFGGQVTKEYIEALKKDGLSANGPMYAEFAQHMLPQGLAEDSKLQEQTHIVLQGISMGAGHADQTLKNLPEGIQKITHGLMDVPAGVHTNPLRGVQVALGMAVETGGRSLFDPMMKGLMKRGGSFIAYMSQRTGIGADSKEQARLKSEAIFRVTGLKILQGLPLQTEYTQDKNNKPHHTKYFLRTGIKDPLTTGLGRLRMVADKIGKLVKTHAVLRREKEPERYVGQEPLPEKYKAFDVKTAFFQKKDSLEVPINKTHFFMNKNYDRYAQVIYNCQNLFRSSAPQAA